MNPLPILRLSPLLLLLSACMNLQPPACPAGQDQVVQDLLYFGTDKPTGEVSPADWTKFLDTTVTPRFPEGLTAWQASGQWRSASGEIVQEPSYVLSLVHPESPAADKSINELVEAYKTQFEQEAVLQVRSRACLSL